MPITPLKPYQPPTMHLCASFTPSRPIFKTCGDTFTQNHLVITIRCLRSSTDSHPLHQKLPISSHSHWNTGAESVRRIYSHHRRTSRTIIRAPSGSSASIPSGLTPPPLADRSQNPGPCDNTPVEAPFESHTPPCLKKPSTSYSFPPPDWFTSPHPSVFSCFQYCVIHIQRIVEASVITTPSFKSIYFVNDFHTNILKPHPFPTYKSDILPFLT